jgi:uncharacterized protein YgiM (DUF1202 family)
MMSDQNSPKNDLPDWLRGDSDSDWEQPSSEPEDSAPNRPQESTPVDDDLPPWLADETEEETPAVVDDSGKLSQDFLAKADQLADRVETELTYDEWIAIQRDSKRTRDIEEEIPDLLSDAGPVDPTEISDTGQLPDWFLGLEELDTSDAPEWFTGESLPSTSSLIETDDDDVPPWLAGMEAPPPKPPTKSLIPDELPPLDDIPLPDFFSSDQPASELPPLDDEPDFFGSSDELPPADWLASTEAPPLDDEPLPDFFGSSDQPSDELPPADWLTEQEQPRLSTDWLGGLDEPEASPAASADEPPRRLSTDWLGGLDEPEERPAAFEDELPADSWLADIGSSDAPPADQFQTTILPERDIDLPSAESFDISSLPDEPEAQPIDPRAEAWLNELEGIVGFTQQMDAAEEEPFVQPDANDIDWGFEATPKASDDDSFDWGEPEAVAADEPVPQEEAGDSFDWLNAAGTFDEEPPPAEPEQPDKPIMLTGMLSRFRQPEPPPVDDDEEDVFEPPQMPDFGFDMVDDLPKTNPFGDVEHELRRDPSEPEHMDWESVVRSQSLPDNYFELLDDEQAPPSPESLFDVSEEELESSWLAEQLLSEETPEANVQPDLFALEDEPLEEMPEFNLDLNALDAIPPDLDNLEYDLEIEPPPETPPATTSLPEDESLFADLPDFDYLTQPASEAPAEAEPDLPPDFEAVLGAPPPVNEADFTDDLPAPAEEDMGWLSDDLFADEQQAPVELSDELPDLDWEQPEWDAPETFEPVSEAEPPNLEQPPSERWALDDGEDELSPWESPSEVPADDPLSFLDEPIDEFRDFDRPPAQPESLTEPPDWLSNLEPGEEAPPDEDVLSPFDMPQEAEPEIAPEVDNIEDLDSYLASLTSEDIPFSPETGAMLESNDVDGLFEEPLLPDLSPPPTDNPEDSPTLIGAEWLTELQAKVNEVSAGAIVRQRKDRPVEELPERLQKLRAEGEKISEDAPPVNDSLASLLPNATDALPPAPIKPGVPTFDQPASLTPEQRRKAELLGSLVASDMPARPERMSAVEMTYDSPYFTGLEETESSVIVEKPAEEAKPAPRRKPRTGIYLPIDRWLIALALALAVILPFIVPALRIGDLPPAQFPIGGREAAVFDRIEDLRRGEVALVGIEYGSSAAAEMDGLTNALLRHILLRGAYPVLVGGNPIGLLHAGNLIENINADAEFLDRINLVGGLQPNRDYYLVRYLPGGALGLRAFSEDTAALLLTDINGQATGLNLRSLQDFSLIAVLADNAEDVRTYAEQVAPLARQSLLAAVSYSAAPLVEPFVGSGFTNSPPTLDGLLVGYQDSHTYQQMLEGVSAVRRSARQTAPVLVGPSPTPQPTAQPPESVAPVTGEETPEATAEVIAEATGEAIATAEPTATPRARAAGRTQIGVIRSSSQVNVRSGPGTGSAVITSLRPGTEVIIIGTNEEGTWFNVRLEDGTEGWVSTQLVQVSPESSAEGKGWAKLVRAQPDIDEATSTPRPTRTPQPTDETPEATERPTRRATATTEEIATERPTRRATATEEIATERPTHRATATATEEMATARPTQTPTAEETPEATAEVIAAVPPPPPSPGYRDERWYAMTLGILVSAFIIALGALLNIGRGLLRRR